MAGVERLERYVNGMQQVGHLYKLLYMLNELARSQSGKNCKSKRLRYRDSELPFHAKRLRILWSPLVRSLGPTDFHKHHRISLDLFNKIHDKIEPHIRTNDKYVRKTCCRGAVAVVDSRSRLSMTLKYLAGSKPQDIHHTHGVSRSTVVQAVTRTLDAIVKEFPIDPFPFDDPEALRRIADGYKGKSTGGLFTDCVGAFDGYLLSIHKRCIGKNSGVKDPSKYFTRKGYFGINCQLCCDAYRRVTSLSMLCPGAVPDRLG